ncbi:MAG: transposase [Candidatus Marinimicrobia bacterium]|nr:transposase [Candidatus Neomarinimicrobiota bacterium]
MQEARRIIEVWRCDYNRECPHSSLKHLTPKAFKQAYEKPKTLNSHYNW